MYPNLCYNARVGTDISQQRMTETRTGRAACLLLALVWFVSMGVADTNAYSYPPLLAGLALVILLVISAMIRGAKVVQLSKTAWLSLGIGAYFLIRCLCSPSVVESWQEASTILGCGVFYIAGVYAAQGRSMRTVLTLLVVAGVLNLTYFGLMHYTDIPMEWAGRPAVGPGSNNGRPVTLFVYKNHAAAFLCMVGMLLFASSLWVKSCSGGQRLGLCSIALLCVLVSPECLSRSPYLMSPAMLLIGWILWVVIKLYEDEKLGIGAILSGFCILGMLGVAACSALLEQDMLHFFAGLDSNGRFQIWRATCRLLPQAPAWGYGALSVQWLLSSLQDGGFGFWGLPNMAHNEYLQAWSDYGLLGLFGMAFIIGGHATRGLLVMSSESIAPQRRILTALALMCLAGWTLCSIVDFFWHHFAIAGMTAFAAGITASPYSYTNARRGIRRKVSVQKVQGKGVIAFIGLSATVCCLAIILHTLPAWEAQWEFNQLSRPGADDNGEKRHALLAKLVPTYPATELMDQYFRIPRIRDSWEQEAELLRITLNANPRQLYTASMLAELISRHGCYKEADSIYRRHYRGDGADRNTLGDWGYMYALNLLRWGQHAWATGNKPLSYSLLQYGLNIIKSQYPGWTINVKYRVGENLWKDHGGYMPEWKRYIKAREQDVAVMRMLGVKPDDSWQAPDAGGKPALYRRYGAPESLEKADSAAAAPATAQKE